MLRTLNLDGDGQADLTVHGGVTKAVYAYPSEHYKFWRANSLEWICQMECLAKISRPRPRLKKMFMSEIDSKSAKRELKVTEPRMPCYKLGIKFGRPDIIKRFLASRRTGFYFAVVRQGTVSAGDAFKFVGREQEKSALPMSRGCMPLRRMMQKSLRAAIEVDALPEGGRVISDIGSRSR
jgi:MOSC domain-containing protein YiiM